MRTTKYTSLKLIELSQALSTPTANIKSINGSNSSRKRSSRSIFRSIIHRLAYPRKICLDITSKRCSVQWQLPRVGCEFWTAYGGWTLAICKKRFASRHCESRGRAGHEGITLCSRLSTRETRTTMFFAYAQLVYRTEPKSKSATFASCRVGEDTSGVHVATGWSARETGTKERPLEVESLAGVESRCRDEPAPFSRELPLIGEGRKVIGVGCLPRENRKLIALGLEVCDLGNWFIFREVYVFLFDVVPRHLYRRVKRYD